jgi:hypothetical protein
VRQGPSGALPSCRRQQNVPLLTKWTTLLVAATLRSNAFRAVS